MTSIPLIVVSAYLLLLLVLGLASYFRSKGGEEDYYLAGRRQGWIVSSLTIMATYFSSFALLGAPGKVYTEGIVFALFALNVPLSGACVWVLGHRIAALGRRYGFVTPGDMIADYYGGHAIRFLVSLACVLYVVPYVIMQIKAGGLLFDALVDESIFAALGVDNFTAGSVLLALITTVYVTIGGMRSVAWTDVLQGLLLIGGMLLGGFIVVATLGGVANFADEVARLPKEYLTAPGAAGGYPWLMLLSVCLFSSTGTMVTPAQWMRYYAARSAATLRRSALIFALVLTACFLFGVMLVGLGGRVLYPDGIDAAGNAFRPDQILVVVLHNKLPELWPAAGIWMSSILVTAIAAASMSTADSNLHALSAVLTRDIYDRYVRPRATPRERTWVGRSIILAATAVALILVIGGRPDDDAVTGSGSSLLARSLEMIADIGFLAISFSMQLLPVSVDLLWLRKGTRAGATFGLLAGLATTAIFYAVFDKGGPTIAGVEIKLLTGVWGLAANCLVFFLLSFQGQPPRKAAEYGEFLDGL